MRSPWLTFLLVTVVLVKCEEPPLIRTKRAAIPVNALSWPGSVIPYIIDKSVFSMLDYGLYLHELGHVLGLDHEHTRADRDKYLHVNDAGVPENFKLFFTKKTKENLHTYDSPYDLQSIMHYGRSVSSNYVQTSISNAKIKFDCRKLADRLECYRNASFMTAYCRKTCGFCYKHTLSAVVMSSLA
ncbi:unnamed protein product [Taenia asiatica]|uniref:Metalloendopeptidase n=1 Tax=Taenia asiatica TaxID=60517 RepID=A0A0R3W4K4_TAEAS|nr:unnamed protein product [Taenia asiatica]